MKYLFLIALSLFMIGCGQADQQNASESKESIKITEAEISTLDSLGIEKDILTSIREFTDSSISTLQTSFNIYNDTIKKVETIVKKHKGFSFNAEQNEARSIVLQLKDELKTKGYLIYISDANFGYEPDQVSVLKGTDQFSILRTEQTDGINYGLENVDVIKKLEEWNEKYPFQIIGADLDWVEAIFIQKPKDMKTFSEELYEFCPDIVDQGTGSIKKLELEMAKSEILYLWWD